MKTHYLFILDQCERLLKDKEVSILDYGCGAGEIVEEGLRRGLNIRGVDVFYEGNRSIEQVRKKGMLGKEILRIEDGRIPHPEGSFDLIISNQVFEHLHDMESVLREIHRVAKPGGLILCLFPSKETLREGHCGIPLAHWFPGGSKSQYYYLLLFRLLGFGAFKGNKSRTQWAKDFSDWLARFTCYRTSGEIRSTFHPFFPDMEHLEAGYMAYRLQHSRLKSLAPLSRIRPLRPLFRMACRRLGMSVILARRQ